MLFCILGTSKQSLVQLCMCTVVYVYLRIKAVCIIHRVSLIGWIRNFIFRVEPFTRPSSCALSKQIYFKIM